MNLYLLGSMEYRLQEFAHSARVLDNFEAAQDLSDAAQKVHDALEKLKQSPPSAEGGSK